MQPVDANSLFSQIAQQGALFAFMLLVIIVLVMAIRVLYTRNVALGDMFQKALTDSTVAVNNNTLAQNAIARQIEVMTNVNR